MSQPRRRRLVDRVFDRFSRKAVEWQNDHGQSFLTLHRRPRYAVEIGTFPEPGISTPRVAVVMQGPPYTGHDFTLETLRLYTRQMPGAHLILSTWQDTDPGFLAQVRDLGVTVLLNEKPAYAGLFNVNMQIVTASAGVRRAVADGAEWIVKTRTDQRLHAPDILPFLVSLAQTFPVRGSTAQKFRILGLGLGTLKYAPYHVTDQTLFGSATDMLAYWTPALREKEHREDWPTTSPDVYSSLSAAEICRYAAPESYLASQFLERMGHRLDWTIADSWAAYRDCFCFVDPATSDLYWVKTQTYSQREHVFSYQSLTNRTEMGFRDWLLLHSGAFGPKDAERYEGALDARFGSPVLRP
jgi:WavE lipopolysaccharide synthesis